MRRWWPIVVIALLLAASPRTALACSCAGATKLQAAANVAVVFAGVVTSITRPFSLGVPCTASSADTVVAVFEVDTVYKGQLPQTVTVRTASGGPSCGVDFVTGKRYTVFATFGDSSLETNLCRGNLEGTIVPSEYGLDEGRPPKV